jgi:hypothetical protein
MWLIGTSHEKFSLSSQKGNACKYYLSPTYHFNLIKRILLAFLFENSEFNAILMLHVVYKLIADWLIIEEH